MFAALTIESESVDSKTPALFRALRNPTALGRLSDNWIYSNVVLDQGRPLKLMDLPLFVPHVMRDTAAANALEHGADIAKVREWLGLANIQTPRVHNRRHTQAEDWPTFKVAYQADFPCPATRPRVCCWQFP